MSKKTLQAELHDAVTREFIRQIKADGDTPAALMKQAIEFLRDNGTTADPRTGSLRKLTDDLDLVGDDVGPRVPRIVRQA